MEKIAVISDVHGNMPALEAVLEDIRGRGIDLIYNLGDLVGKGARSDLAIDRCRKVCQHIVRGNWDDGWDEAVVNTPRDPMVDWYYQQLGDERLSFLSTLPNVIDFWLSGKRVRLFHASQESIYKRVYPTDSYEVHRAMFTNTVFTGFDQPEPDIVGYGDIHTTYMRTLLDDHKILFNVGSVGNSLDIPLASYVILTGMFDSREGGAFSIDFIRLSYDIEREIAEAQRLSVPDAEAYAIELRTSVYRGRQKQNTV